MEKSHKSLAMAELQEKRHFLVFKMTLLLQKLRLDDHYYILREVASCLPVTPACLKLRLTEG